MKGDQEKQTCAFSSCELKMANHTENVTKKMAGHTENIDNNIIITLPYTATYVIFLF